MKTKIKNWLQLIWLVNFVRGLSRTAGNVAESVFVLATLWVIVNVIAHSILVWFIPTRIIELLNYISLVSFSALPELILVAVIEKTLMLGMKKRRIWFTLYTIPCSVFVYLTVSLLFHFTDTAGTFKVELNQFDLVLRVLSGWFYALINMMYARLQEPNDLQIIDDLKTENKELADQIETNTSVFNSQLEGLNEEINNLKTKRKQASRARLDSEIRPSEWLINQVKTGIKTVEISRLIEETGATKREVTTLINQGHLELDRRAKDRVRLKSVAEWLEIPVPIES